MQGHTAADGCYACGGVNRCAAEIGGPLRILDLFRHAFKLTLANCRKVYTMRCGSGIGFTVYYLNGEHTRYLQVTIGFAAVFDAATHTVVEYITEPIA